MSIKPLEIASGKFYKVMDSLGFSQQEAYAILDWIANGKMKISDLEQTKYLNLFTRLGKAVPFKSPKVVYRGMVINREIAIALVKGKTFKLKPSLITSWTANPKIAARYTHGEVGVILTAKPTKVVFDINAATIKAIGISSRDVYNKEETLIAGNLLKVVRQENVFAFRYYGKLVSPQKMKNILADEGFI